jgi:hypothetical protein
VAARLLGLRVRIPPSMCCVLSVKIKGKLHDNQDKEPSTDDVHTKYTRI